MTTTPTERMALSRREIEWFPGGEGGTQCSNAVRLPGACYYSARGKIFTWNAILINLLRVSWMDMSYCFSEGLIFEIVISWSLQYWMSQVCFTHWAVSFVTRFVHPHWGALLGHGWPRWGRTRVKQEQHRFGRSVGRGLWAMNVPDCLSGGGPKPFRVSREDVQAVYRDRPTWQDLLYSALLCVGGFGKNWFAATIVALHPGRSRVWKQCAAFLRVLPNRRRRRWQLTAVSVEQCNLEGCCMDKRSRNLKCLTVHNQNKFCELRSSDSK